MGRENHSSLSSEVSQIPIPPAGPAGSPHAAARAALEVSRGRSDGAAARRLKVGVLASGRGSNLDAIARACEEGRAPAEVVVVICDVEGAGAFGVASRHGIPALLVRPRDFAGKASYETKIVSVLRSHGVDLVALAGYMRVVGRTLLEAYRGRIMNIHPSLLPAFPGLEAQKQALEYGVKVSGCTVHFVDEGIDSGPIIVQRAVEVFDEDTPETLAARILEKEHEIFPEAIRLFAEGRLRIEGRRVCVMKV